MAATDPARAGLIRRLLPSWVAVSETSADAAEGDLFPAELKVIANASPERRAEFSAVRACGRRALAELGIDPVAILAGEHGAPRWPDGVIGTMTHCTGYRAAAVALTQHGAALGVDVEPHLPLPEGVVSADRSVARLPGRVGRGGP